MANEMRDRLVELFKKIEYTPYLGSLSISNLALQFTDYALYSICDDLIENGVVVPPCKVGETVYCINTFFQDDPRINECEVDTLHITSGKNRIGYKKPSYALVRNKIMKSLSTRIYFEDFGKTVFLTKSEAEQKLKEMRGE